MSSSGTEAVTALAEVDGEDVIAEVDEAVWEVGVDGLTRKRS